MRRCQTVNYPCSHIFPLKISAIYWKLFMHIYNSRRHCVHTHTHTHENTFTLFIYIILYIYKKYVQGKKEESIVRLSRYLQACFCFHADHRHYRFDKLSFRKHVRCLDVFGTVRSAQGYVEGERKRERERRRKRNDSRVCAREYIYIRTLIQSRAHEDTLYRGPWLCLSSSRSVSASSFVFSPK